MKSSPIITRYVFEPSPSPETGTRNVGWPPSPDLVEASDEVIWCENSNTLINASANADSSPL